MYNDALVPTLPAIPSPVFESPRLIYFIHTLILAYFPSFNPLTPNALQRRRAMSPLKIKIPSKNMREKPTNTPIIHSVY
jgi:hypothetical protein